MKNRVFNAFLLLALVGTLFTACKKEYPQPPIQDLPIGKVYTISEILALEPGTVFNEDASVYGIITADEVSGNLYKAAFMQDRATGAAIELYLNAVSGVRIGDSVRIYLKDVTYAMYNNLPQLSNFEADGHIIILANNKPIEPALATIDEITQGKYLAGLVRLENVKFTEQNTFADPTTYGNRTLIDPMNPSSNVIVRTSNYANFANDSLPQGIGNLTAIATVYNSTWQLIIRSARELEFDGYVPGGANDLPYCEFFASSFGTYTTYDVKGAQHWEIDYSTAKMTGYVNNTNYENEDWLISAKFSLENVSSASMTMSYIARFFNNVNEDITVWVSSDYTSGDPNLANWEQIPATWVEGSSWTDFASTTIDLTRYVGQKVRVAVKYLSNNNRAGTIEVQSICIQEGSGPTPPPGPGTGGELQYMPYKQMFTDEFGTYMTYDVLGGQEWGISHNAATMTGYSGASYANEDWLISSPVSITGVGLSEAKVSVVYVAQYQSNNSEDVTLQVSTDYVYGNDPTTATWAQLPASYPNTSGWSDWKTIETSLNGYIGETITVAIKYVSDDSQSRTIEIQSITVEEGSAVGPTPPPGPGTVEGDGSRENPYTANDIILLGIETSDGNKYWVKDYIVGVIDGNYVYQFTSSTDVNTNIILSSNQNAGSDSECIPVQLPAGEVRTGLNLADNPGNLGQEVLLYGTLEKYFRVPGVKNVTYAEINGNSFGTDPGDTPPTPPTPGETIFSETFANGQGAFTIQDVVMPSELTYIWQHAPSYSCMKASAYVGQAYAAESWLVSPAINLSSVSSAKLSFSQAVNYASPQGALSVMISTNYNGDVTTATWSELSLDQWPAGNNWAFITSSADLTPHVGQNVTIAFKYTSTTSASATWEVKDIVVEE